MMIIKTLMGLLVCVAVGVAYLYFPLQWRRHKDIEHGNTLITNVQQYRAKYFRLPETSDEATLQQLGFIKNKIGWQPQYIKHSDNDFEIIYRDGSLPPFLHWQSNTQHWTLDASK